jgi:hypothetical protein
MRWPLRAVLLGTLVSVPNALGTRSRRPGRPHHDAVGDGRLPDQDERAPEGMSLP